MSKKFASAAGVLVSVWMLAVVSCGAPSAPKPIPPSAPAAPLPTAVPAPAASLTVDVTRPFDESLLTGREFLMQRLPSVAPAVADYDIGPLGVPEGAEGRVAVAFLDELESVKGSAMSSRWGGYLKARILQLKQENWGGSQKRWTPKQSPEEGGVLYTVRLKNQGRLAKLYLYLELEDGVWRASDLQLLELEEPRPFDGTNRVPSLLP